MKRRKNESFADFVLRVVNSKEFEKLRKKFRKHNLQPLTELYSERSSNANSGGRGDTWPEHVCVPRDICPGPGGML